MRIAYHLAGHLRSFRENQALVENLLKPNPGDVFVHIYSRHNVRGTWHGDVAGADDVTSPDDVAYIAENYPGIRSLVVDPATGGHEYAPPSFRAGASARHHFAKAAEARHAYEKERGVSYDLVFHARFDLYVQEPVTLPRPVPGTVYGSHAKPNGVDGDVFMFGTPVDMDRLTLPPFPDEAEQVASSSGMEGEQVTTSIRKRLGLEYAIFPMKHGLMRSFGIMMVRW